MEVYLTEQQERILKHILSLKRNQKNGVYMGLHMEGTCPDGISEKDLITGLKALEQYGLITVKWIDIHRSSLDYACEIFIEKDGSKYFNDKKLEKKNIKWEKKKFRISVILSILSLIVSVSGIFANLYINNKLDELAQLVYSIFSK